MKPVKQMTDIELAAYVSTNLRNKGIDVVLSGGTCVSIYSNRTYVSMDLDLVNLRLAKRSRIMSAMQELGFQEYNRYFRHPDTEYLIEFPAGPLAVGDEPVKQIDEIMVSTGTLRLLSPTDTVKDRLTWYYHNQDLQCLEQAILVAQNNSIDLAELERWSKVERMQNKFEVIRPRLVK